MPENDQDQNPQDQDPNSAQGSAPAAGATVPVKKTRAPRKSKSKAKPKGKSVRIPVMSMLVQVVPTDARPQFTLPLDGVFTASAAEAAVLKLAQSKEQAENMAGATVRIVAVVDQFTINSVTSVSVKAKR